MKAPPAPHRRAFTLVELLVVISIVALLISLLLPAMSRARAAAQVALCASQERQFALAMVAWANDNDGNLPDPSSYADHTVLNRGMRQREDFWTQLYPDFIPKMESWYCPAGPFFADDKPPPAVGFTGRWWFFHDTITPGNAGFTYAFYCNAPEILGFDQIPRKLADPGSYILVNDWTVLNLNLPHQANYALANHPASMPVWIQGAPYIRPDGVNIARLDTSVQWHAVAATEPGYPGAGGQPVVWRLPQPRE